MNVRYQILTTRRMSTFGACTRLRLAWTWCSRDYYLTYLHSRHLRQRARKLIIDPGKKTLIVKG